MQEFFFLYCFVTNSLFIGTAGNLQKSALKLRSNITENHILK